MTPAPFTVAFRLPISRWQLHLMTPASGSVRKYGGTVTRYGFTKGDYVEAQSVIKQLYHFTKILIQFAPPTSSAPEASPASLNV